MTFKNQSSAHFAYVHPPVPFKFTIKSQRLLDQSKQNFFRRRRIIGGINATFHVAILRSCCQNASVENEDGVRQFSTTRATNRLSQQRPLIEPSQFEYGIIKLTNCFTFSKFAKRLVKIS